MQKNIVEVAVANGSFNTLVAAVQAAGLVDTLSGDGPFTVFAPTDEAFAKLPAGTVETLLKPENLAKLQGILTYHVISGKVMSSDIQPTQMVKTVNGKEVSIKLSGGTVNVDSAKVVAADVAVVEQPGRAQKLVDHRRPANAPPAHLIQTQAQTETQT